MEASFTFSFLHHLACEDVWILNNGHRLLAEVVCKNGSRSRSYLETLALKRRSVCWCLFIPAQTFRISSPCRAAVPRRGQQSLNSAWRRRLAELPRDAAEPLYQRRRSAATAQGGGTPSLQPRPAARRWARSPRNKGPADRGQRRPPVRAGTCRVGSRRVTDGPLLLSIT